MATIKPVSKVISVAKGTATYKEAIRRAKVYVVNDNKATLNALNDESSDVAVFYVGNDIYSIKIRIGMSTELIYVILDKSFRVKEEPKEFKSIW